VCSLSNAWAQLPSYAPTEDLIAWYNLDGSSADASGNEYHGAAFNMSTAQDRLGQEGGAYFFNGSTSEVSIPYAPAFNSFPFSVSLWCLLADDMNGGMLIQHYSNSSWNGWVLGIGGTGTPQQTMAPGYMLAAPPNCNGVVSNAQCATGINDSHSLFNNQWHMLTFTIDGDSGRFYLDGTWRTSQAWTGSPGSPTNTDNVRIGGTDLGDLFFFHGSIDEVGMWSRALNAGEVAQLYNGMPASVGCTNTNACNYNPAAITDDGTCVFDCAGCIDPCACNYNQNAAFNDGSCDYTCNQAMSMITVFHDANENGLFESDERPMQYWPVQIAELEKTVYTDADGMVVVPLPAGTMHYQLLNSTANWVETTPTLAEINVPGNTQAFFGLKHATGAGQAEAEELVGYFSHVHCEQGFEGGLYVHNKGGQTLHGTLTFTVDQTIVPFGPWSSSVAPDSVSEGYAQWDVQELHPWETRLLAFHAMGPGPESVGQSWIYNFQLNLWNEQGETVYSQVFNSEKTVSCSEYVLRTQTDPVGFDEPFHYVAEGSHISFRVQVQNTTSDWAQDAMFLQNLNSQQVDLVSVELLYASEALVGCLHDDGTIDLEFSGVMLAPSSTDPSQSGAFAVYRARLNDGIAPDSTFYHTSHVVFDMDQTAGSDTMYHTIYDCSRLSNVFGNTTYCEGDTLDLRAGEAWIESYRWLLGDSVLSTNSSLHIPLEAGFYNVVSQFSNPVCYVCEHNPIDVQPLPQGEIALVNDTLFSWSDLPCRWFINGIPSIDTSSMYLVVQEDGVYQAMWTSAAGCEAWSQEILVNDVNERFGEWDMFPNPAHTYVRVDLPTACNVQILDAGGRNLRQLQSAAGSVLLDVSDLSAGVYCLRVRTDSGVGMRLLVIE